MFTRAGQPSLQCCGTACGGGDRWGTMQLPCLSLAPLSNELMCETGNFSHSSNHRSPQSALSLSFSFSQLLLRGTLPHPGSFQPAPPTWSTLLWVSSAQLAAHLLPTRLVECFLNSFVVGVPCSLIFWHFWLFIVFRLVVILLLVV